MFASSFAAVFAGIEQRYICPVMAQAALVGGIGWQMEGDGLAVGGRRLIGPAGKVFAFASPATAARWIESTRYIGERERDLIAAIDPVPAALWKARKREKLAVIAARVIGAAARTADDAKRAALIAEADFLLNKWG